MANSHRFITNTDLKRVGISKAKLVRLFNIHDGGKRTQAEIQPSGVWITFVNED